MNGSLLDDLMSQLQGQPAGQIAQQLGTDSNTIEQAIGAALPMIVGALGNNAASPGGADALFNALQRDHSGGGGAPDLGGLLGGLLGGGAGAAGGLGGLGGLLGSVLGGGAPASRQLNSDGILGHIFGGNQPRAQAGLGQATGLGSDKAGQLLKILAPIVMAFLAKKVLAGGMNASNLGQTLGTERSRVQSQGGVGGALMNAVLDQDGDGKVDLSDLLK
ncbi:MAG: DUF937 domain-containing protein, partial [Brachymonas sp.]|nr:DUF937 domain-containing protein [Brachymonas sp.]